MVEVSSRGSKQMLYEKTEDIVQKTRTYPSKPKRRTILSWNFHEVKQDKLREGTQNVKRSFEFGIVKFLPVQSNATTLVAWTERLVG